MDAQEKARRRAAAARELERRKREEEEWLAWRQAEPPTGAGARMQSVRDAAFELLLEHGQVYPGPALARQKLAQLFSDMGDNEGSAIYFEAYDQSLKLLRTAEALAETYRKGRVSQLGALLGFKERCPGFSMATYEAAFAHGLFVTR